MTGGSESKRLILWRHAKSSWDRPGLSDKERTLNERGRRSAPAMGRWLAGMGYTPDLILTSDSVRTRETVALARPEFEAERGGHAPRIIYISALYLAGAREILHVLKDHGDPDADTTMIVAHNPGLAVLALSLPPKDMRHDVEHMIGKFPTAAAAIFRLPREGIGGELAGRCALEAFMKPKSLPA
jgi:phosphohistidine phosphatase